MRGLHLSMVGLLLRLLLFTVDTILVARWRLRRIEAGLHTYSAHATANSSRRNIIYLNQVLALWLGDKWLELGGGEGVDETRFRDHEK